MLLMLNNQRYFCARFYKIHSFLHIVSFICFIALFIVSCVIPTETIEKKLNMSIDGGDTISPFGTILIRFNMSLSDSVISFRLIPDQLVISALLDPESMIAYIRLNTPLKGNSLYALVPQNVITSSVGSRLNSSDSILFFTHHREIEPNNFNETADTLQSKMYGIISTVDDTDCYVIMDSLIRYINFDTFGSSVSLIVKDSNGKIIEKSTGVTDTLVIPASMNIPLYVSVSSYLKSAGCYYKIGFLSK